VPILERDAMGGGTSRALAASAASVADVSVAAASVPAG